MNEFNSLISDPLSRQSEIVFAKYPGLRELLAAELQKGDIQLEVTPEESTKIEPVRSKVEEIETKVVEDDPLREPEIVLPMLPESIELPTIQTPTHITPNSISERELTKNALTLVSDNFDISNPGEMSDKYEQFRKWLTESQGDAQLPSFNEIMNDTDANDVFSDSDEFLDAVEQTSSPIESQTIPSIKTMSVDDEHIYETLTNMPLSVSQLSASMSPSSCRSSASDLTVDSSASRQRRAAHNKGQAPAPPTLSTPIVPVEAATTKTTTVGKATEKDTKFRNFLNYIPNILKPISPASSTKNLHIETDI